MPQHWVNVVHRPDPDRRGAGRHLAAPGGVCWRGCGQRLIRQGAATRLSRTSPLVRDARASARLRRGPGAGRRQPAALSGRDPGPGRRQLGRQVDADEDHDRRLPPRRGRGSGRRPADPLPRARTRAASVGHRDDLPGLRAVREPGRRLQHVPRPLADRGLVRRPQADGGRGGRGAEAAQGRRQLMSGSGSRACRAAASSRSRSRARSSSSPRC